ncbi:MAG: nuclear transport factor 2 family protein [Ardenticatenaceae bacterium]|nr:nuclear transport factor 2 family protein [Ardenticatenaceae bacterium]
MIDQIKRYEKAHNAYDIEAAMAFFAQDAVFEMAGLGTLSNLDKIRALHEYDRGIHAQLSFQSCLVDDLTATCEVREKNDWATAVGMDHFYYPSSVFTFTPSGHIKKIVATMSVEDGLAVREILGEFIPWLRSERPEESQPLFTPNGEFIYSEANGILVVELLKQWRAAN